MAQLPSAKDLGVVGVQPSLGVASYRGATGEEGGGARGILTAASEFGQAADYLVKAQNEHDRMSAEDALNKYRADLLKKQYDEKDGWQTKLGEQATNPELIKRHIESTQQSMDQIGATLSPGAQRYFRPQAQASRMHSEASFYQHVATQRLQQDLNIFNTGRQLILDGVSRNALGPQGDMQMQSAIDELRTKSETFALRRGLSPEEATALSNENITAVVMARVNGALSVDRPDEAKRIFDTNAKLLGQKGIDAMQGKVNDAFKKWKTFNIADAEVQRISEKVEAANAAVPPGGSAPAAPITTGNTSFDRVIPGLLKREGGFVASDGASKAPANFGINQAANPDINVRNLTKEQAVEIYRTRYWNAVGADNLSPAMQVVALDAAAQFGPANAKRMVDASNGDYQTMLRYARERYRVLVESGNPEYVKFKQVWADRSKGVEEEAKRAAAGLPAPTPMAPEGGFQTARTRMMQEELKTLNDSVRKAYIAEFGDKDPEGLAMALQRAHALMQNRINEENGIQQGNLNAITTEILNRGIDNVRDLQAVPGMPDKLRTAGPYMQNIVSLMNMVGHQKSGGALHGDPATYFDLTRRIVNGEIKADKDLLPYLMDPTKPGSVGLDMTQFNALQNQIARMQRPETKSVEQDMHYINIGAAPVMTTLAGQAGIFVNPDNPMDRGKAIVTNALAKWNIDVRRELRNADPAKLEKLLDRKGPEYIARPERLNKYLLEEKNLLDPKLDMVPPTPDEMRAIPTVKADKAGHVNKGDKAYKEIKPAVQTPQGWQGGYYMTPDKKVHQKLPPGGVPIGG